MLAYHNDSAVKEKHLGRVAAHRAADELVQGYGYWKNGKGCAVGCTIHGNSHRAYEDELGIPATIAHLEDGLFERLPKELARQWPERFLSAIQPGADLSKVTARFMVWSLADPADGVIRFVQEERFARQKAVVEQCAALWQRIIDGGTVADKEWSKAARAAARAARAAAEAAWAAVEAARAARAAAWAAWAAAEAARAAVEAARAARAAARAAWAAWAAAWAAAEAAEAAEAARAEKQADKLIELLEAAPVAEAPHA